MEKKQLNLNAPLLSVRRIPSSLVSPNVQKQNGAKIEKSLLSRRYTLPSHTDRNLDQVTEPVAVPFMWEHIPGRPKSKSGPLFLPRENHSISPRILSQRFKDRKQQSSKEDEDKKLFKIEKEALSSGNSPRMERLIVSDQKEGPDSEDDNDAFSDALEILSPTESFSFSCVSDLTGYTGPNSGPSGRVTADPHIRDFMLHRFLPAAKAMALEPTPYTVRKMPVSSEQPREVKKIVSVDKPLQNPQELSSIINNYIHENDNDDSESEDVCDSPANFPGSACGFLPLFCAKNSGCILNPMPDIKGRSNSPKVYASEVRRLARAAYSGPRSQPPNKDTMEAKSKQTVDSRIRSHGIHEGTKEVNTKQADETDQLIAHSRGLQETNAPSPQRPSGRRCISPYRNQRPDSPFREGVGFLGIPKAAEKVNRGSSKFLGILPHQRNERDSGSARFTAEKILYIDSLTTVHKKEDENLSAATVKEPMGSTYENKQNCVLLIPKVSASLVADMLSKSNIPYLKGAAGLDQGPLQEIKSLGVNKISAGDDERINSEPNAKEDDTEGSTVCTSQSPFPPLPKTPAQSWLWRVLPSVKANPFSDSRKISRKTTTSTKWETVVRTSKTQYDDMRYSEELTTHVQKHSKN